ncbi:hypothetical protein PPERSA_04236 [Pseudocohnilembus persalinus]|uniref:Uncharacterized protein n=1 Tax=Pseudocohnilembus persalinus TaxID=266149 RepID=A0A0V0QP10_PSEPJ|nr:hypothetical protein PPERSA_04236 [Pseudocohnilembus persalinus]|eukprot:KRX03728.1 hypothetical protein PPERSA_04236 [Pseudocohnilembus persalinus]
MAENTSNINYKRPLQIENKKTKQKKIIQDSAQLKKAIQTWTLKMCNEVHENHKVKFWKDWEDLSYQQNFGIEDGQYLHIVYSDCEKYRYDLNKILWSEKFKYKANSLQFCNKCPEFYIQAMKLLDEIVYKEIDQFIEANEYVIDNVFEIL